MPSTSARADAELQARVRALASPVRLRILRLCLHEERTNKELADELGMNPGTLLYHVRTLASLGFLRAGEPRRGRRGSREVPYRATGLSWRMEGVGDAAPGRDPALAAFLEEVAAVGEERLESSRLGLRLGPEDLATFRRRMYDLLDEYARRPPDRDGEKWSLYLGMHPER